MMEGIHSREWYVGKGGRFEKHKGIGEGL